MVKLQQKIVLLAIIIIFLVIICFFGYQTAFVTENRNDYVSIKNNYFWNPLLNNGTGDYWIPKGISYQTWLPELNQQQNESILETDLDLIKNVGADAIRADFSWKHIEIADGVYNFSNYDLLLEEAQKRGIKIFPLIGYQWGPAFLQDCNATHPPDANHTEEWKSDTVSYENPNVRKKFSDFISVVTSRYSVGGEREDLGNVVAGWILGNEYGYIGLWSGKYEGYDNYSKNAFRIWLKEKYNNSIEKLNSQWEEDNIQTSGYLPNYPYSSFDNIDMPIPFDYGGNLTGIYLARDKASWYDLTEWREQSIANFVALGAEAAKKSDRYHLISYSAVGMQWGEEDYRYHTEDASKIVAACKKIGYPLDFWSINNYAYAKKDDELISLKWGIVRAKHDTQLPVMITETGYPSNEILYQGLNQDEERQAKLVKRAVWESLMSGAIGISVFHLTDRSGMDSYIGKEMLSREESFGLVHLDRTPKPAYSALKETYNQIKSELNKSFFLSSGQKPDIAFLWEDATDTIYNRYVAEMKGLFGALERLGFEPNFLNQEEFSNGGYKNFKVIVLPRNQKMSNDTFNTLNKVYESNVKIHADADLPGIMNEYSVPREKQLWLAEIKNIFGINATASTINSLENGEQKDGYEMSSVYWWGGYVLKYLYAKDSSFENGILLWKFSDRILEDGGKTIMTFDNQNGNPALVLNKKDDKSKYYDSAISLFSMGDALISFNDRSFLAEKIYVDAFGLKPVMSSSNQLVLVNYRILSNNNVLIFAMNYDNEKTQFTEITSELLKDKKVTNLLYPGKDVYNVIKSGEGTVTVTAIEPDGFVLLLASSK